MLQEADAQGKAAKRVLIVEDDDRLREALQELLSASGYQTLTAEDGLEALDWLSRLPVHLIISDLLMPRLPGHRLIQRVRETKEWRAIPILLLSAFVWLRHIATTQRQRFQKMIPQSCFICGEHLPKAPLRQVGQVQNPHYQTAHPDFWRWVRKPRRRMMLAVLFTVLIIWVVAVYELVISNYLLFITGGALSAVLALAWILLENRKLKSFRSQWRMTYKS